MTHVVLLGPQRHHPNVRATLDQLGVDGPIAVVTAGWEERESELDDLAEHLKCDTHNLRLYARAETALEQDQELFQARSELNDELRSLQSWYRLRLAHAMSAVRELDLQGQQDELSPAHLQRELSEELEHALGAVHVLDQHHRRRTDDVLNTFDEHMKPTERESIAKLRAKIRRTLSRCAAVTIAGGHVAVLLGRMRLFVLHELLGELPVVAWSAGAMAVTEQVVLFHDSPPQGRGDPEVLTGGLGLCPNLVALPHARQRLLLDDEQRVSIMSRRFAPASCIALDEGSRAAWDGKAWTLGAGTQRLGKDGSLQNGSGS